MLSPQDVSDLMATDAFVKSIPQRSGSIAPELFAALDQAMDEGDEEAIINSLQRLLDAATEVSRKGTLIQQELAERMSVVESLVQKVLNA